MKLRNKKTGEIKNINHAHILMHFNDGETKCVNSLAELNENWEDYNEPKGSALDLMILTLTNFIENEPDEDKVDLEDCKQMLKKLKAWKRLKDNGFRFQFWTSSYSGDNIAFFVDWIDSDSKEQMTKDLDLLFGGEE